MRSGSQCADWEGTNEKPRTNRLKQPNVSSRRTSRRINESKQGGGVCVDVNETNVGMWGGRGGWRKKTLNG